MRGSELDDRLPDSAGFRAVRRRDDEVPRLAQVLQDVRGRAFVGRDTETALFRDALCAVSRCSVLYLHGPSGAGKTTLLRQFAAEAQSAGRVVLRMDRYDPVGIVASVLAAQPLEPGGGGAPVLLFDDFAQWRRAEAWLREDFLPGLAIGTVVVLTDQAPPDIAWTADPGWRDVLLVREIAEFDDAAVEAWLDHEAVPGDRRPLLREVAGGHPLALRLGAEAIAAGLADHDVRLRVARALVRRSLGELPSAAHRRAVEICAYADRVTERMLLAGMPGTDPVVLLHWLLDQPWAAGDTGGVRLRPYLRRAVRTELGWRDPAGETAVRDLVGRLGAGEPLTRPAFDAAVRAALREYRRPDLLAGNPLVHGRMVLTAAGHADPAQALRAVLREAADAMGQDPREAKAHRALVATYMSTAPTQDAAAQRLGLPFSTYRRHLTRGVQVLADLLWRRELA
ncbi:AAA family ATPase [Actinoplanes sp. NPDC023714]|uniref:ATP-binding protein n=1 Tax=Actinoplanes sp. NPDC023714 TaxID=3154322 RepID=UPI0034011E80